MSFHWWKVDDDDIFHYSSHVLHRLLNYYSCISDLILVLHRKRGDQRILLRLTSKETLVSEINKSKLNQNKLNRPNRQCLVFKKKK